MHETQRTLRRTATELSEQAQETAERVPARVRTGVREATLVLIGAADFCRERIGDLVTTLAETPRSLRDAALRAPARVRDAVEDLHERGEDLVRSIDRRPRVREAVRDVREATTSARRAFASGAEAAREVAATAAGEETAYEEWTYAELYQLAAAKEIEGRSTMTKDELIAALRRR